MMPERPSKRQRTRKAFKTTVVVLGIVLALCCVGGILAVSLVGYDIHQAPRAEAQIREFGDAFARHLEAAEYDAAYEALSVAARGRYTRQTFARGLTDRKRPTEHSIDEASGLLWHTYVTIDFTYPGWRYDGAHTFDLVKEGGLWKVDSDPLHDLDTVPRHGGGGGDD